MSDVVYLHIGAPKTGTTYLQDKLARNKSQLAEHGFHFPSRLRDGDPATSHFRSALDVLGQDWGGAPGHADGAWSAMVRKVRRSSGSSVISHEILAPARRDVVRRIMADLDGAEVHIVYSARDLARALPAAWQESVKQGRKWRFGTFLDKTEKGDTFSFRAFDVPSVLTTWAESLPPERVHLVTLPKSGPRDELWHRFCTAMNIDPAWAPREAQRSNTSLGLVETEVLRRLNRRIGTAARHELAYDALIRQLLEEGLPRTERKIELPPARYGWAEEQTGRWLDWIRGAGIDVVGDLDDLLMPEPPAEWVEPRKISSKELAEAAMATLAAMTEMAASRPAPKPELISRVRSRARQARGH